MGGFKRVAAGLCAVALLLAACTSNSAPPANPTPTPTPTIAPALDATLLSESLKPLLVQPELGSRVGIAVYDVSRQTFLIENSSEFIPASTAKLFTLTAVDLMLPTAEVDINKSSKEIARVLRESDNRGAEKLSKLLAESPLKILAREFPKLDLSQTYIADAAGLSRKSKTTPNTLAHLLALVWLDPRTTAVATGLPLAGVEGTMKKRSRDLAGTYFAKTGTLSGVNSLAGIFITKSGRSITFAIMADRIPVQPGATTKARKAIDRIATALLSAN